MKIRVPRSRKFPPRISQEDLKDKIAVDMKEKGAYNHFQAEFYEAVSREVYGSKNFLFSTLQPKVKMHSEEEEWQMAYDFVFDFLRKNKMDLVIKAMDIEFGTEKIIPINLFDGVDRNQYFEDLIDQAKNSESFSKHVADFAQKENI